MYLISDPDYRKFLEFYNGDDEKLASTPETLLEELEAKSKELVGRMTVHLMKICILKHSICVLKLTQNPWNYFQ